MQIHNIKPVHKQKKSVKVGRGGKRGKTAGRGTKGQKARSGRKIRPEIRDVIKRLPKLRGRGKSTLTSIETKPHVVNVGALEEVFKAGETVSPVSLLEKGLIKGSKSAKKVIVKILGGGELSKKLVFEDVVFSAEAKAKVEKAGGVLPVPAPLTAAK